jgi:hypothetical protein
MMKKEIPKIKIYIKSDSSSSIHPYQSVTNQNKNKISLFFENNLDIKKKMKKVDELREVCFFKEGYEPRWEEEYYIDGSKYLCSIQIYENSEFRKMIEEMIKMILLRYKNMVGIRIKKKKQKKYDIQFWTIELKENSKLVEKINHIFHFLKKNKLNIDYNKNKFESLCNIVENCVKNSELESDFRYF